MLFVTKNGTRKHVTEAVRPMIRMVEMTGGIPFGFWDDPIIIGYLTGSIHGLINLISNAKYTGADTGEIIISVFIDLLGTRDGETVSRRSVALQGNDVYCEAFKASYLSVMIARHGPGKFMDQTIVVKAIAHSRQMAVITQSIFGTVHDETSISSAIQDLVFGRRVEALRA